MSDLALPVTLPWYEAAARRFLLPLFFAVLSLPVALQQTILGLLLALFAIQSWRRRELPTAHLNRALLLLFASFLLSTFLSPDVITSLLGYRKFWLVGAFFVTAV